ncbi:MAG: OpgC domain-containing protein [Burkholderiales bacterium]|nr:OpgC domain-containing protein [Burkholderiales bacterium]
MATQPAGTPARRPRDQRLDLFRGVTMLIIFIAHVPENPWRDWIPARFGFSSGTELFVFCSGVASALAFGPVFLTLGLALGTARIAYRWWQVYWAHVGLFFASIAVDASIDRLTGTTQTLARQFGPLLVDPVGAVVGAMTLTWLPEYLDILPMYLVILALAPVVMAARRIHPLGPFVVVSALYALAWLRELHLVGNPWTQDPWFLNPFGWQLIFFLGFFFAMGWLPVPRLRRRGLLIACAAFLLASIPVTFWAILDASETALAIHVRLLPINAKADLHPLRVLHFLALAYVVLSLIDPVRERLAEGLAGRTLVMVGRQSLATFLASLVLARIAGALLDLAGRDVATVALANLAGLATVVAVAAVVGWFKRAPWAAQLRAQAARPVREPDVTDRPMPASAA